METLSQYLARKQAERNGQSAAAAEIVLQSVVVPPDAAASDMQIASDYAKATGAPAPPLPMVQEHRSIFEAAIERQKNATFLRSSPKLSEWLRRPENAQLARDDVEGLSWFEGFGKGTSNTLSRAGQRLGQTYNQARFEQTAERAADRGRSFGQILDDERATLGEGPDAVKAWPNLSNVIGAFGRYADAQYAELIGTDDEASARQFFEAMQANVQAIRATPKSAIATEAERTAFVDGASLGQTLSNIGQTAISNPVGLLSWVMETAGESAPQLAAAIGVTAATRNPMAGVAVGTGGSYATERFTAPADFFEEKGIDLADPGAAARVMSNPALIREAADRGVIRGLVVSAFDGLSLGLAGRSFSRSPFVEGIAQVVQQAFSGAAGEYAARQASGQATDWNDIVAEGLAGLATAPADMLTAGRGLPRERQRVVGAAEGAARIADVTAAASTSKTRQRSPDAFRNFVARAAAGGEAETMYVPAREFARYFQDMGLDPYEIARGMEGVDFAAIDAEMDAGGDIAIPTATYAARIAGSEHDRFFAENARFDPGGMSEAEARAFNERATDALDEAWQEAEALRQEDERYRSFEAEIFDTMVSRLRQAGRATDVATTEATLYPAFYRTMAERSGQTLDEFLRLYPLPQVRGDVPQGMQMRDVDALSRTLAEARSQRAVKADGRQSLLEWISDRGGINDPGGELRARDAAVVKRGRGRKNLRLERAEGGQDLTGARFGADDVAQAAIEAGFLADAPIAADYRAALAEGREVPDITPALWEAIDEELRGDRQFAEAKADDVERSEEVGEVEAYLAGLGVSLDDDDATIRAAVERDQAGRGRRYEQTNIASSLRGLIDFARNASTAVTRKLALGDVTPAAAVLFRSAGAPDVQGYSHDIDANAIRHVLKNHGDPRRESARGQIAVTDDDIAAIPSLLAAPDYLVTGAKNARRQDLVGYIKAMPDGTVLYLEEVRTGRRTLSAVTMRKYPATANYLSIAKTVSTNARNDGGDGVNVTPVPVNSKTLFQEARGAISLPAGGIGRGQTVIDLFRSANLSTVVHESGHYFLAVTQDLATGGEAGAASDMEALRGWWRGNAGDVARDASRAGGAAVTAADVEAAIDAGTTGDAAKDAAIDVGMQEQFARAFETYLMEGKAPSVALRPAFERFRAWLTAIYRRLRGLDVSVSPEVRAVFDRLLATDAEIREAETESGGHDLVFATAEQMGLDEAQFAALLKLRDQAKADAAARLLRDTMEPLKREREAWFREERARVTTEVEAEVNGYRQYRAFEWMANRRWLGGETPEGFADMRMDKAMLVQRYGEGVLSTLPRGQFTVYAVEGGVDPDYVAAVFGFDTGDDLVRMLERSPPRAEAIRDEVERRILERHGDVLRDGSVEAVALDAVHTDRRGQALAAELKALNDVAGTDLGLTHKEAREIARRTLERAKVRDARAAGRYLAAERKAGQEAIRLAGAATRSGLWADAARRRVETRARAAVRSGDAAAVADPRRLSRSIDRANAAAGRANEEVARLVEAKRRQLLNHMLYAEARTIDVEVEAALTRAAKLNRVDSRQADTANIDYVRAARAIAAKFGLARPDSTFDFSAWMEQLRYDDEAVADTLTEAIATYSNDARPFRDLTVGEFRALQDAIANIVETGKRYRTLEIGGQKIDRAAAIGGMVAVLRDRTRQENPALKASLTRAQIRGRSLLSFVAALRRMENWTRDLDDGKAGGAFTRYLVRPVFDAMGTYRAEKSRRLKELLAILEPRRADLLSGAIAAPELGGHTFANKAELLHAILHTGNASNLEKLLLGRGWSGGMVGQEQARTARGTPRTDRQGNPVMTRGRVDTSRWDAFVARMASEGRLTKADFDTAQQVWDLMEELKRPAQRAHRAMLGFYFAEIEAAPVVTPFGTYRGGYVPAVIDRFASVDGQGRADQDVAGQQSSSFMFPTTGRGFTKSRVQGYRQPLALDLTLLPSHMDKVLRFTHLEPAIRQTAAIVTQRDMRSALDAFDPEITGNLIVPWLQRTATQAIETPPPVSAGRNAGQFWRTLRRRVGAATMFGNVVNAAQQVTGFSSAAVLVKPARLKVALIRFAKGGAAQMRADAVAASPYMRDRIEEGTQQVSRRIEDVVVKPTTIREVDAWVDRHAYFMQTAFQNVVDVITWHAAYDQATAAGMEDADAVFEADSVIRRTMGDFAPENVSLFETGTPFVRLCTMFMSYFNGQANLVGGEMQTAMRTLGFAGTPRMFYVFAMGVTIPAVISELIVRAAGEGFDDEDDDGYLDEMASLFFGSQAKYVAGMVPVAGQFANMVLNRMDGEVYNDRLNVSPIVTAFERAARAPYSAGGAIFGEGSAHTATIDGVNTLGLVLGIPTGQIAKTLGYAAGVAEGYSEPEGAVDVVRGLVSGRDGSER